MAPAATASLAPAGPRGHLALATVLLAVFLHVHVIEGQLPGPRSAIESAAAAGTPLVEVRGVQLLTATVVVSAPLTIRGHGDARIDCQDLPTAFRVRWVPCVVPSTGAAPSGLALGGTRLSSRAGIAPA